MKPLSQMLVQGMAVAAAACALFFAGGALAYTEKTLYKFCSEKNCADGAYPHDLATDGQGNFYGTTFGGGIGVDRNNPIGDGTVFEFSPSTGTFQTLYRFCSLEDCADGKNPYRVKLVIDANGNLYGTTQNGGNPKAQGGTVFELVNGNSGWRYKVLYTFCSVRNCKDGGLSEVGLAYAGQSAGTFYDGVSPFYGVNRFSIFELIRKKSEVWKEKIIHQFCQEQDCVDGAYPGSPLYLDNAGNFYGTTEIGGQSNKGVAYELSAQGDGTYAYSVLYNFCAQDGCADGASPLGSVAVDQFGNLFGTTEAGGDTNNGVLFSLSPQEGGWQHNILKSVKGKTGSVPVGVTLDNDGNLFGATYRGGERDKGSVFEYNGTFQTVYNVCQEDKCPEGAHPFASVLLDSAGNLFGADENEGFHNGGTLFELVNDKPTHRAK